MTLGTSKKRDQNWSNLDTTQWDAIVIGGGITGAGIACELSRQNLKVLLLEQKDYAWGTSSRSSKMVHGGLRYIAEGDIKLTRESVVEREHLLKSLPGLVERLPYLFAARKKVFPNRFLFGALLSLYDLLALKWDHRFLSREKIMQLVPGWRSEGLIGATQYSDAVTDDARLVLRVLQEAEAHGATALNYTRVNKLSFQQGQVDGVYVRNELNLEEKVVHARVVINATGAWADKVRKPVNSETKVRPLRGSHIVVPAEKLPVTQAVTCMHPEDKRPVFVFPWEGVTVVGTTDVDHGDALDEEAQISGAEFDYLMTLIGHQFPASRIGVEDVISTFSGVRPVVSSGKGADPSKERRDHSVWNDRGLITVTGGKLTTFRVIAWDVIERCRGIFPDLAMGLKKKPMFAAIDNNSFVSDNSAHMSLTDLKRLRGLYGNHHISLAKQCVDPRKWEKIGATRFAWQELIWSCQNEQICYLDDLLLRRTRIGLLLPNGGANYQSEIEAICKEHLGWSSEIWRQQWQRYQQIIREHYGIPGSAQEVIESQIA